jgi:hypothetical protein
MATPKNQLTIEEFREAILKSKKLKEKERVKRIHTQFTDWLTTNKLAFLPEYHFNKSKQFGEKDWRNDYFIPELNLAIEVEGGIWSNGGHLRPAMYLDNLNKYNGVTMAGIRLLRIDTDRLNSLHFKGLILSLKTNGRNL